MIFLSKALAVALAAAWSVPLGFRPPRLCYLDHMLHALREGGLVAAGTIDAGGVAGNDQAGSCSSSVMQEGSAQLIGDGGAAADDLALSSVAGSSSFRARRQSS